MRFRECLITALAVSAAAASVGAQTPPPPAPWPSTHVMRLGPGGRGFAIDEQPRAVIGVTTSGAATSRDTLGLLVSSVRSGSPAEKAGIEEGNRIASINGLNLRLAAADVGDDEMSGIMTRRLTRELDKLKPGDEVDLRIHANGQTRLVKVKTIAPEDLYESETRRRDFERPTLGLDIGTTGSARDSIGVLVMGVVDGGPAAKAGIEEGSRIVSINGVDLRASHPSDEDSFFRASNVGRLEREVSRLKPGDDVELRVHFNGQSRAVRLKAGRVSDLPRRSRSMTIMRGDDMAFPPLARVDIDGARIGDEVRRVFDGARFGALLGRFGNRVEW
jgi:C-terminal processing protease CtpA/Prc